MKRIEEMTPTEEADLYQGALAVLEEGHCSGSMVDTEGRHCLMGAIAVTMGYSDQELSTITSPTGAGIPDLGEFPMLDSLALRRSEKVRRECQKVPHLASQLTPRVMFNDCEEKETTRDLLREAIRIKRAEAAAGVEQPKSLAETPEWVSNHA